VSTASLHCRVRLQRLRVGWFNAPLIPGGFMAGPSALRLKRLQWPANMSGKHFKSPALFLCCRGTPCDLVLCKICHFAEKAASRSGFPLRLRRVSSHKSHLHVVTPAKAGVLLSFGLQGPKVDASPRWHNGIRVGKSGSEATRQLRRAFAPFFHKILIGREARAGTSPPLFSAPALIRKLEQIFGRGRQFIHSTGPP
jgi:hypothetical protein